MGSEGRGINKKVKAKLDKIVSIKMVRAFDSLNVSVATAIICDRIANGILEATKMVDVHVPVIVRLDGTNAPEAAEILKNANIKNVIAADDLLDGAKKAVAAAKGEL